MRILYIFSAVSLLLTAACSGPSAVRTEPHKQNAPVSGSGVFVEGVASWYGGHFHGRRTANGEIYDKNLLTAAHRELPFHTLVRVTRLDNRSSVVVRINDRGPFVKNRIIDLSLKAARRIGMTEEGTARVRLEIVKPGGGFVRNDHMVTRDRDIPLTAPQAGVQVQAGAFSSRENAFSRAEEIRKLTDQCSWQVERTAGIYRVLSGPVARETAQKLLLQLQNAGIDAFIRTQP